MRVVGTRLLELEEHLVGADEEHVVSGPAGCMAESRSEEGFADAHASHEENVLLGLEKTEREEVANAMAIEAHRGIPVEILEDLLLGKGGAFETPLQIDLVASVDFVLQDKFQEVFTRQFCLLSVGDPLRQRRKDPRELEPLQNRFQ